MLHNLTTEFLNSQQQSLLNILEDIVNSIHIDPSFCISHPDYRAWKLPIEMVESWQKMPIDHQQQYLQLQLQGFIYNIYYNGSYQANYRTDNHESDISSSSPVENNTIQGLNREFYEQLHESNWGKGYFDSGWSILQQKDDNILTVYKNDLTLHIERKYHLPLAQKNAQVGDSVAILMPHNLLENRSYIAISNQGLVDYCHQIVNFYFHIKSVGAALLMSSLTQQLNPLEIPFTFKILYDPKDYGVYDAGVLQIEKINYPLVKSILREIYDQECCYFGAEIPLFTKFIAPGLALAEQPKYSTQPLTLYQESFGMHRCKVIADGLLAAWEQGNELPQQRMKAILEQFSCQDIKLDCPYLEANSQDIYVK